MDDMIQQFCQITDSTPEKAQSYLQVSEYNVEQAIELFFSTGGVDMDVSPAQAPTLPPRQGASNSAPIDLEDDDVREAMNASSSRPLPVDDDEAYARRLQEEFYGSGPGGSGGRGGDPDDVRAPIPVTRETLVGGPDDDDDEDDAYSYPTLPARRRWTRNGPYFYPADNFVASRRAGPAGIFNQRVPSVWSDVEAEGPSAEERRQRLAEATDGASERSAQHRGLAEMYRPPFEIISHLTFDQARDEAKEDQKWILVNVQEASYFQSQTLNRDIWKDKAVMDSVKENFIFLQMDRVGRDGKDYVRLYMTEAARPGMSAQDPVINQLFPHIAIIDPRTGEQVKVWTAMPTNSAEFLHQLHEFLDRYSLRADAKNPVARTSKPKVDVAHMTEDQMLEMALQASLGGASGTPPAHDPDQFTRDEPGADLMDFEAEADTKGKETAEQTPFEKISNSNHHSEPPQGPDVTRIQFRLHDGSRVVRRFLLKDPVERLFEYVKADLLPEQAAKKGDDSHVDKEFELVTMGKRLIDILDETVEGAGLKSASIMVETIE